MSCKNIVEKYDKHIDKSYKKNNFTSHTVDIDNHEIFYYDNQRENVPILLFVHGFGGDGKISWKDQAEAFEKDYRVIIPDILWFGSSKSEDAPELQTQIDAINGLMGHLALEQVHIVGISYGGFIALGVAQQNQVKLASLTMVDSPGVHFSDEELQVFCDKVGVEHVADAFVPENSDGVSRMMRFAFRKPPHFTSGIKEQILGFYMSKYPVEQRVMLENLPENRNEFIKLDINVPVLILWGEEDQVFLKEDGKQLQEQLGAKMVIIPKAGHSLPVEQPKKFNKALRSFIEGVE